MTEKMKKILWEMISTILYIAFVLCMTWLIIHFIGQRTIVDGVSMEPTLQNNDNLIVDKISYRLHDPERFDIIVFPCEYIREGDSLLIKRIIGMPGETVQIQPDGTILINGEVLEENYGKEIIAENTRGRAAEPVVLGEDEYFVLGDNRNNSSDSRMSFVGNVKRDEIIGRAWVRVWPLSGFGKLRHQ